ncbi:MAG: AsmA family protein [Casimicrobiaceae bacterium]
MRRPYLTVVGVAVATLLALVIAAAVAVWRLDPAVLVGPLAERVKATTGRELTVRGGVSLEPSLEPGIKLRDVSLGNGPGAAEGALLQVQEVDVKVALWPLLSRRVEIRHVILTAPVLKLERGPDGRGNWEIGSAGGNKPAGADAPAPADLALVVRSAEIRKGVVTYRAATGKEPTRVEVANFTLEAGDPQAPINFAFRGAVDGVPVSLSGNGGPLAGLLARTPAYPLKVDAEWAGTKASLDTKVTHDEKATRLEPFSAVLGTSRLTGNLVIEQTTGRPRLRLSVTASRLVLADLAGALAAMSSAQSASGGRSQQQARPGTHLISDAALPLEALSALDAAGELTIAELVWADGHAQQVHADFALRDGTLKVSALQATVFGGKAEGHVTIDAAAEPPGLDLALTARDIELGSLLSAVGAPREVRGGKSVLRMNLTARGTSLQAWAASVRGEADLVVGAATLTNAKGQAASALGRLTAAVNPFAGSDPVTQLKCVVVRLPLANGQARFDRTVALETDKLGVSATGVLDLRNETVDVSIDPIVREGIPINVAQVAQLVRVKGPWREPRVEIDKAKSIATVARLGAIVATGGLAALGGLLVLDAATAEGPCAVANDPSKARATPAKSQNTSQPAANPAEQLLQGLGKLFR